MPGATMTDTKLPTRPSDATSPWRMFSVIAVAILAGGGILGGFIASPLFKMPSAELTDDERALLITVGDFEPWLPTLAVRHDQEQFSKTRLGESGAILQYVYDERNSEPPLLVDCRVVIEQSEERAGVEFMRLLADPPSVAGVEAEERGINDRDVSQYYALRENGFVVGHVFFCRQGNAVFSLVVFGVAFDSRDELDELIRPVMIGLTAYGPRDEEQTD